MSIKTMITITKVLMVAGMCVFSVGMLTGIPHETMTLVGVMVLLLDMTRKILSG